MASTVNELLLWQRALVSDKLLSEESSVLLTTRGKLSGGKDIAYGLGVFIQQINGNLAIRHGGGISGFRSEVVHFPGSNLTIAILSNTASANTYSYATQIAREILAAEK